MKHLELISVTTAAKTYSFRTTGEGFKSWALCTINDLTGELVITSDWGSWQHRWNASPEALGHPTLTAFIGERADVDYLARKLARGSGSEFSPEKTAQALQRKLCERRLNDGRCQIEHRLEPDDLVDGKVPDRYARRYTPQGLPIFTSSYNDEEYLSAEKAREIWDDLDATAADIGNGPAGEALFFERALRIDGVSEYITEEPWEYMETSEDRALREVVLPALIAACRARTEQPTATSTFGVMAW